MKRFALFLCVSACGLPPSQDASQLCPATGEPEGRAAPSVFVTGEDLFSLALANNALVYLDKKSDTIHRIGLDGSGDTVIFSSPTSGKTILDVSAKGDVVYATEQEIGVTVTTRLLRIPLAGGEPVATDLPTFYGHFLSVSDTEIYLKAANDGNPMSLIARFTLADNTTTQLLGPWIIESALVGADSIYYLTRDSLGDDAAKRRFTKAPKTAGATGTAIPNTFCRGSIFATPTALFCSGYSSTGTGSPTSSTITKTALDGTGAVTWLDLSEVHKGSGANISPGVGDEVLVTLRGARDDTPLLAVNLDNGNARVLSCTALSPNDHQGDDRPLLVASSDTVYWIADRTTIYKTSFR